MDPENRDQRARTVNNYTTKKCPYCYTYLKLDAGRCTTCRARVGDVDKLGFAAKPTDWRAYLIAAASIVIFSLFMWWGFFRD